MYYENFKISIKFFFAVNRICIIKCTLKILYIKHVIYNTQIQITIPTRKKEKVNVL